MAESHTDAGLTVERRLGGAGMHMTAAERREITIAYLTDPDLGTISACAKHFKRTREAVSGCLKGPEFDTLRRHIDQEAGDAAKRTLMRAREKAASAWVNTAIDAAAEKGDHKPARDLLVATKVIEPAPTTGSMFIGVAIGGRVEWRDQETGAVCDELPEGVRLAVQIGALDSDVQISAAGAKALNGEVIEHG